MMIAVHYARGHRSWMLTVAIASGLVAGVGGIAMAAQYDDIVTADSPIGYWRFEDASSSNGSAATDSTGSSTNDTYQGSVSLSTNTLSRIGGKAASFNGSTAYVNLGADMRDELNGATAVTSEAWIKNTDMPSGSDIYYIFRNIMDEGRSAVGFRVLSSSIAQSGRAAAGDAFQNLGAAYNDSSTWHHTAGVLDYANDRIDVYIDGTLAASEARAFNSPYTKGSDTTYDDTIGAFDSGAYVSYGFKGLIDEVAVYDKDLGRKAVQTHYDVGANPGGVSLAMQADAIANGDFENPSYLSGWTVSDPSSELVETTGLNGSESAVWMEEGSPQIQQSGLDVGARWVYDIFFAVEDPDTGGTPDERAFHAIIRTPEDIGGDCGGIILRVTEDGHFQAHNNVNGIGWETVFASAIEFSADGDTDQDFTTGANSVLNEYHLRLIGHYNLATPSYDILLSEANEFAFDAGTCAYGLTRYNTRAPSQGEGLDYVQFVTFLSDGSYVVDQVRLVTMIPEPSSLVLLTVGGVWLLLVRRRKRSRG